eukprot:XP_001695251.1 predicted protein [Chlamydomonas reinhardtii]
MLACPFKIASLGNSWALSATSRHHGGVQRGLTPHSWRALAQRLSRRRPPLDDVATRRADLHEDYERAAQGLPPRAVVRRVDLPAAAAATLGAIRDTLARLWQVCRCREIRICRWLAVSHAAVGSTAMVAPRRGTRSAAPTPRQHHFWDCAVAKAVLAQINAHNPGPAPISQAQLWLVQAPPGFQQCVWDVVVMVALAATEHGRVRLRGMTRAAAAWDFRRRGQQLQRLRWHITSGRG